MTREELLAELGPRIGDARVLAAIGAVPRDAFVEPGDRGRAWANQALGIGCGQTISQPLVVARMCEALAIEPGDRVLDVGTGSGYHAAVLAALGARVITIELHPELSALAAARLRVVAPGVEVVVGDGRRGHPPGAPFDAICVAATAEREAPPALLEQLARRGRLIVPVRTRRHERLMLYRRGSRGFAATELEDVRFVPLVEPEESEGGSGGR